MVVENKYMISIVQLKELIKEYQDKEAAFSKELDPEIVALMKAESEFTFSYFQRLVLILETYPDLITNAKSTIQTFFNLRWLALKTTNLAYTRHPFLPVNQLCLKIAEVIADPEESICRILMPTVLELNRKSYSLKAESEDDGHFYLEQFMLNKNQTLLIPVEEIFEAAAINTNTVFKDFQDDQIQLQYTLGGRDLLNLEQVAGQASQAYVQALKRYHLQQYDDDTLGFAISCLATDVKKGSVSDSGSENFADNELIAHAIKKFYDLWRSLPEEIKSQVKILKLLHYGSSLPLESYFLALFVRHPDCPLSDEELCRQKQENIFPCADQIANYLDEFLKQHPMLFTLMLNKAAKETKDKLPELKPLLDNALQALKNRSQTVESDDNLLFNGLVALMFKSEPAVQNSIKTVAVVMAAHVHNYQHLIALLPYPELFREVLHIVQPRLGQLRNVLGIHELFLVLSEENQRTVVDAKFDELFWSVRDTINDYRQLSGSLKPKVQAYFEALYLNRLAEEITTFEELQKAVKKLKRSELLEQFLLILKPKFSIVLTNPDNVIHILPELTESAQKIVIESLIEQLTQWINPDNYVAFTEALHWKLHDDFKKLYFRKRLDDLKSLTDCLRQLEIWKSFEDIQKYIIDQLQSELSQSWITDGTLLLSFMNVLAPKHRLGVFVPCSRLLSTKTLFSDCLKLIPTDSRERFLSAVSFELFITNLDDLKEIAAMVHPGREQSIIFKKFNSRTLNCSVDAFNELTKCHSGMQSIDKSVVQKIVKDLEYYIYNAQNPAQIEIAKKLIGTLQNSLLSDRDIIDELNKSLKKIKESYSVHLMRGSRLGDLIKQALLLIHDSANIDSNDDELPSKPASAYVSAYSGSLFSAFFRHQTHNLFTQPDTMDNEATADLPRFLL